jgi:hypothetical protein
LTAAHGAPKAPICNRLAFLEAKERREKSIMAKIRTYEMTFRILKLLMIGQCTTPRIPSHFANKTTSRILLFPAPKIRTMRGPAPSPWAASALLIPVLDAFEM